GIMRRDHDGGETACLSLFVKMLQYQQRDRLHALCCSRYYLFTSLLDWVPVLAVAGNQETHTEGEEWVEKSGSPSWAWVTVPVVCSKELSTTVTPERRSGENPSGLCTTI